ncbi:hypothetical protein [Microbacterium sp. NPDC089696]|uniref:hypothetical protein n=1 Tax=Microbacterium sp. NPDC089696 TaxID=3364199 RepID=UPI003819CB61
MSNKKRILTGHVARVVGGVLVAAGPGDPAPDWVTNPNLIAADDTASTDTSGGQTPEPAAPAPKAADAEKDDLSDLGIEALRDLAEKAGVAKSGKKTEIAARIRAKRAAGTPDGNDGAGDDGNADHDVLVAKATALGVEDAEKLTDDELTAAIESFEE